jgi:two-component sensor histidine kinase
LGAEVRRYLSGSESLRQKLLSARDTLKPAVFEKIRARVIELERAREELTRETRNVQGIPVVQALERALASISRLNQGVEGLARRLDEFIAQAG